MRAKITVLATIVMCATATAQPTKYAVDGLALGMQLNVDNESYRQYRCSPSDQFDGLTWCQKTQRDRGPRGSSAIYSLLHSPDGSVFYINRAQEGGVSNSKQAQDQIQQHSQALGESAQLMKMPRKNGVPDGLIAVWGKVRLEQLDQDSIKTLLDRKVLKKGLLIDFLGNFSRSAKAGLPIYRIDGGPGLVWATNFGQKGRGIVRLAAVDLTRLVAPPVEQQPVAQSSGNSSEVSERPQPELSIMTEKVQSDVIDAAAMTAESEKAKAAPVPDQIEATKDGKAKVEAVPAPFEGKSAVSDVNSGWDTVRYGVIGLLVVVMTAFTAVIYIRGHKASTSQVQAWVPRTTLIAAPAQPVIVQELSPEAALAKIEEIRRSLLELAASPSLVPSPTPEEAISSTVPAERRRKVVERA